jgi:dipeptidyl aminopeptidase/acylaminoacyl peptidase
VIVGAAVVALALPAALALLVAERYYRAAQLQMEFPRVHVGPSERSEAARALGALEDVELRTDDALVLRGWYHPSRNRAAVVLVHGGGANRTELLPEATALARSGFGVLVYDARASGESDGVRVTWGVEEQWDLRAAIDFLVARSDVDSARVGAQGLSVGGSTVALGAARDRRIRAVLLNATWTSLRDEVDHKLGKYGRLSTTAALYAFERAGIDVDAVRPVDHVAEIAPRALFVATGERDTDTPVSAMRTLFAAAGSPKELWIVPGAPHGGYAKAAPGVYEERVVRFFTSSLLGP